MSPDVRTITLVCILAAAGCQTREIGAGQDGPSGTLVFSDDFEGAELGEHWHRGSGEGGKGKWTVKDGALHARDIKNDALWLKKPLPQNVRVEFDAVALSAEGDLKVEIFGDGERHESGYIIIFGGWKNSLDVVARLDEHGEDRKSQSSRKVKPNTVHKIVVERSKGPLIWSVDGKRVMTYDDGKPLTGSEHAFFAFNNWTAPVKFDNLRVYDLGP